MDKLILNCQKEMVAVNFELTILLAVLLCIGGFLVNWLCSIMPDDPKRDDWVDYASYLSSKHWKRTRKQKLSIDPKCEKCGTKKNLHIHHLRYYRDGKSILYHEDINKDLQTLCSSCHTRTHNRMRKCG